jgi:hypothetical protein
VLRWSQAYGNGQRRPFVFLRPRLVDCSILFPSERPKYAAPVNRPPSSSPLSRCKHT